MKGFKKLKADGVSLRSVLNVLIVLAVTLSAFLIICTFRILSTFQSLSSATDEYIELERAAHELMNASDYLTEMAQRFTVDGDMRFLDAYFEEAFETNRRDNAINKMGENSDSAEALKKLQQAMDESLYLMNTEFYSMKLVIEAKGYQEYPERLDEVALSEADAALSADEKMARANNIVLNDEYYEQKDIIRDKMKESLSELESFTHSVQKHSSEELGAEFNVIRGIIIVQAASILFMIWMTARLGIHPVITAVERIRDDSPIPEIGANEFRYLARTYNKMYDVYKQSVARLNYKVSHDELTGVYNRAGYNLLLDGIEMGSTYLIIFDADHFKSINDTYGHEAGDKILQKIAAVLRNNFRADDYVCRIGGDEFVVLMLHAEKRLNQLIVSKIKKINFDLADTSDKLPEISVSAGIAYGKQANNTADFFEKADKALYDTKRRGGKGFTFFRADSEYGKVGLTTT